MSNDDFFIGWAETPKVDRRFFTLAGVGLMLGTGAFAASVAVRQKPAGPGSWDIGTVREWRGIVTSEPYPMLRTIDIDGTVRTAILGCQGKCGVAMRMDILSGKSVIIKGSLIERGAHAMIAVVDGPDWIKADEGAGSPPEALAFPVLEAVGTATLQGIILDSKCWFGAMRPNEGKVHKACASLCIRGGIPPAFFARDKKGQAALMIMTSNDAPHGADLLPFLADPVEVTATLKKRDEMLFMDAPTTRLKRLS